LGLALFLVGGCATRGFPPGGQVQNLDHVDGKLWRGAQPNFLGVEDLARRGVKTVVNLRDDPLPAERAWCGSLGLAYVPIPMAGWGIPADGEVRAALAAIETGPGPVFVHCRLGCDRTGTIVACYRICHGWTAAQALSEAKAYGMSWTEFGMRGYVRRFKP